MAAWDLVFSVNGLTFCKNRLCSLVPYWTCLTQQHLSKPVVMNTQLPHTHTLKHTLQSSSTTLSYEGGEITAAQTLLWIAVPPPPNSTSSLKKSSQHKMAWNVSWWVLKCCCWKCNTEPHLCCDPPAQHNNNERFKNKRSRLCCESLRLTPRWRRSESGRGALWETWPGWLLPAVCRLRQTSQSKGCNWHEQ